MTAWAEWEDEVLKTHWPKGASVRQIQALVASRTRNAVIGRIHRLGLAIAGQAAARRASGAPRPTPEQVRAAAPRMKAHLPPGAELDAKRDLLKAQQTVILSSFAANDDVYLADARPLVERPFGGCAWPVGEPSRPGEQMCCARQAVRGVYCADHAKRAFSTATAVSAEEMIRSLRRVA